VGPATYYNNIVTNTGRGMFFSFETNAIPGSNRQQFNGHPGIRAAASNLGTAPVFASNYSLQAGSPGIDDGRALGAPTIDMANHHRPLGNQVDIGAFER
jgi:hypothetical protein